MTMKALISVSNKTGLDSLAHALVANGYEIVSTGGTLRYLQDNKIPVTAVSD
ncbi:MAG: bifunctional phosphoribosylaminoimidazolecarboxamide formyltransferase/IMP cyclohydrolase, partial [Candidatus Marinamargulisbacteria bacterium]|nr:bifunctional phosphoribosylaminoimidazolecarboxamide formyltransferase/IMP cyclohydrolase [Candidatus Marinamargulisbacteria bacterium]